MSLDLCVRRSWYHVVTGRCDRCGGCAFLRALVTRPRITWLCRQCLAVWEAALPRDGTPLAGDWRARGGS